MKDDFYRALEDKYRGSRSQIADRLSVYLPYIRSVFEIYPGSSAIDLGCGRGEWLEVLIKVGFKPCGIDLDENMLFECEQRGLPVVKGDALELLSQIESNSQVVVSAFHVVEHLSFEQLRNLVSNALRVLKPGGLLILETPNPENIAVSCSNFYLDPTHLKPIPPKLLAFVAEFEGFARVKTLRLQEPKEIADSQAIGLMDVINHVSPDFSIIAQKKTQEKIMANSQELFNVELGVSLDDLLIKIDQRLERMERIANESFTLAQHAEAKAEKVNIFTVLTQTFRRKK